MAQPLLTSWPAGAVLDRGSIALDRLADSVRLVRRGAASILVLWANDTDGWGAEQSSAKASSSGCAR